MQNLDDLAFSLIMSPFNLLKVKYEVRKEGEMYKAIIPMSEIHRVFKTNLGGLTAVKMGDTLSFMKSEGLGNVEVEDAGNEIKVKMGDITEISLTDDKIVSALHESFQERFNKLVSVTKDGNNVVVSCTRPSKIMINLLNSSGSPFKIEAGKLVFKF